MHMNPSHCHWRAKRLNQTGVGLIEVLVALIIMSVGLLGIASLYVTALQAKTTSLSRMKAVTLAQDMADRIRANSSVASAYAIAVSDTQTTLGNSQNCSGTTVTCTDTQMALYDKYEWDKMIYDSSRGMNLPGQPTRSVTISGSSPTIITITLTWQEKSSGNLTYSMQIQV